MGRGPITGAGGDWEFDALGTRWVITTDVPVPQPVSTQILDELERIDLMWSRFRDDSTVAEMARTPGTYQIADTDRRLLVWYRDLYDLTGGAVTPLVGQTLADAGYDADYTLTPAPTVAAVPDWSEVFEPQPPGGGVSLRRAALIDVGAAGKGFAVDRVVEILDEAGVGPYIVDGSGDMRFSPRDKPVRVALEHPMDPTKAIGVIPLTAGALCASASNRRAWASWHHIIDPRTAGPSNEVLATWVLAPEAMLADGLATALFFTPAPTLRSRFSFCPQGFHHVTIRRNGSVEHTDVPGLELFL